MRQVFFGLGFLLVTLAGPALPQESASSLDETRPSPYAKHFGERVGVHQTESEWSHPRIVWVLLMHMADSDAEFPPFADEDRRLLQSIVELDRLAIERQAAEPYITELCALPEDDLRARGRLWNKAEGAAIAFDAQVTSILGRLTPDGARRIEFLVESDNKLRKVIRTDWEGLAVDLPQASQLIFKNMCHNHEMKLDRERLLGKTNGSKYLRLTYRRQEQQ